MKKKIKDLTLEERKAVCLKYNLCGYANCPLVNTHKCYKYNESVLESEVEVDE